jgi:hypothetical protein
MGTTEPNEGEHLGQLAQSIRQAFPDEAFSGRITPADGEWTPELDDYEFLYKALKGQKWSDVPREFLKNMPDGFVLLSEEAFVRFVAAWILESLRDMHIENIVRDFLVYSFENSKRQIRFLNQEQRAVLRAVLDQIAKSDPSKFVRERAVRAAANVIEVPCS